MIRTESSVAKPPAVVTTPGRVLVAIPCFNEELAIGSMVLQARALGADVLVVDDGSKDRTVQVARTAGADVIVHEKNLGKGAGVRNAFRFARDNGYDALVLMDGDGQHDPAEIPALVEPVLRDVDPVDIALGFRFGENTEMPAWRRVGKRFLDYATAAGGAGVVTDSQCGYRAFGPRAILVLADKLRGEGFETESEQLVHANAEKLSSQNVPITCRYDGVDGSTKGPFAHALEVLMNLVELVTFRRPLLFLGTPGFLLLLSAVALGIFTLQSYNVNRVFSVPLALGTATLALLGAFSVLTAMILNIVAGLEKRLRKS